MNTNRIFIGNIIRYNQSCETGVFLKLKNNKYVQLDNIKNIWDIFKINHNQSSIITLSTVKNDTFYIDKNSLTPYYEKQKQKTLRKIKLDYVCDARNPRGIDL